MTFQQAIEQRTGIDVLSHRDVEDLRARIATLDLDVQINGEEWFALATTSSRSSSSRPCSSRPS